MSDWNGLFPNEAREFEKRKCALVTNDLDLFLNSRAQSLRSLRLYRMGGPGFSYGQAKQLRRGRGIHNRGRASTFRLDST